MGNWAAVDEKLKWVLHVQVELLGGLYECEEIISKLLVAEENDIKTLLRELVYRYFFLSQDLSSLYYHLGYSTWNLLYTLDPDYYFGEEIPSILLEKFDKDLCPALPTARESLSAFRRRFIEKGCQERAVKAVEVGLAEWLESADKYKGIVSTLYGSEDMAETLYAFHFAMSIATHLLSRSLSINLLLKSLSNRIQSYPVANDQ